MLKYDVCKYDLMCNVHKIKETLIQINIFLKHTTIWRYGM